MTNTVHDPICHMDIDPTSAAGKSEYEGQSYYFCSPGCLKDFEADPAAALRAEAEYDHSQEMDHGMMGDTSAQAAPRRPWWQFWR